MFMIKLLSYRSLFFHCLNSKKIVTLLRDLIILANTYNKTTNRYNIVVNGTHHDDTRDDTRITSYI